MRFCLCILVILSSPVFAADLERHVFRVAGHDLVVWQKNAVHEKARVLLLHGRTWSSLPNFDLQVEGVDVSFMDLLNEQGISVMALDARGYGATERDQTGWLTPNRAANDVTAIVNQLSSQESGELHLFGWSYGAMVAQLVVQADPALVHSVTLFGYPFDPIRHISAEDQIYAATPPRVRNTIKAARSDFIVPGAITEKVIAAYAAAAVKSDPHRVDFRALHEWSILDARKMKTPFLLIHGEQDPLALTDVHAQLFQVAPVSRKRWVVLPGGGHAALLESPRHEMVRAVSDFILER